MCNIMEMLWNVFVLNSDETEVRQRERERWAEGEESSYSWAPWHSGEEVGGGEEEDREKK